MGLFAVNFEIFDSLYYVADWEKGHILQYFTTLLDNRQQKALYMIYTKLACACTHTHTTALKKEKEKKDGSFLCKY